MRRLFVFLFYSFSRRLFCLSTFRYSSVFVQSRHCAGVDSSASPDFRSVNTSHSRRRFGNIRSSFNRHSCFSGLYELKTGSSLILCWRGSCLFIVYLESIYVVLGCFVLSLGVSLTYWVYLDCSVFSILRSADISRGSRLFGILRFAFSQHISWASAVRCSPLCVQSTHLASVGCSLFFDFRSVNTSRFRRLFGILRYSFPGLH